ncbi:MAG: hypothetical protein JRF50_15055 [Deltaproteobacteria bacterium]|nr:hypothetical protein [Deltaproteobacteria bacterium]
MLGIGIGFFTVTILPMVVQLATIVFTALIAVFGALLPVCIARAKNILETGIETRAKNMG